MQTRSDQVKARLVSERTALRPGTTVLIGFTLEMAPGWHVYWDGANDSGMPVKVTPTLPAGFTAGEMRWPTPKRHISPGDILDYVYEGRVTLVLPVQVPASAKPGELVEFSADLDWFVCKDVCVKGEGKVQLKLPVAAGDAAPPLSADAALFTSGYPAQGAPAWLVSSWKGNTLTLSAQGAEGDPVTGLAFYPHRTSAELADGINQGQAKAPTLRMDIRAGTGEPAGKPAVRGIVEVRRAGTEKTQSFTIDIPVPDGSGS